MNTATTSTLSLFAWYAASTSGASFRQSGHQEAPNVSQTGRPPERYDEKSSGLPS